MGWRKSLKCGLHFKGISSYCKEKSCVVTDGFPLKRNSSFILVLDESDDDMGDRCSDEEASVKEGAGMRKMVRKLKEELEKERQAAATAAEEAMTMIMRLQNEKSMILMESKQERLMAEKKQVHDREVIQSLRWIVKKHESARKVMENRLRCLRRKLRHCMEGSSKNRLQWVDDYYDDDDECLSKFSDAEFEEDGSVPFHPSHKERSDGLLLSSLDLGS